MAQRDTNIALNMTGDGTAAVQRQGTDNPTDSADDTEPGVTNPDGSITVYGTPPDDTGETTTENVPQSPLAGEIAAFEQEMDHPEDWTDAERRAVGLHRRHPDLTDREISDRLDLSKTVVGKARRKVELATLDGTAEIHTALQALTPTQQTVIAARVRDPARTRADLAALADCRPGTTGSIRRRFKPLVRQLRDVGLPDETAALLDESEPTDTSTEQADETAHEPAEEPFTCETCGATFDSVHARNGHTAVHQREDDEAETISETDTGHKTETVSGHAASAASEADGTRPSTDDIKRFVAGLRERASDISPQRHSDSQHGTDGSAVRQVTCDAILTYIDIAGQSR
jgi:transposase-like protein